MRRYLSPALAALLAIGLASPAAAQVFGIGTNTGATGAPEGGVWQDVTGVIESHMSEATAWLGDQFLGLANLFRKSMVLRLVVRGQFHEISFDPAGAQEAARLLALVHPGTDAAGTPGYETSPTWHLLSSLQTPEFREQYERIASLSRDSTKKFYVTIFLDEPSYPVAAGTALSLPGGGSDTLQEGEAFWQFLERHGTTLEAVVALNRQTVRVSAAAWHLRSGNRDVRLAEPRLGWNGGVPEFLATLLHEAAHVGDGSSCGLGLGYGPDGAHSMNEVISPQGAFKEGWANYMASVMPGKEQRGIQNPRPLEIEPASGGRPYTPIVAPTLADYLANEASVARILLGVEQEVGFFPMAMAFMGSNATECRDLGHFLVQLLRRVPHAREQLLALVDRETGGVATREELEALFTEGFPYPAGLPPGESPRVRPAEGAAEVVAADGARLVEDFEALE